MPVLLDTVVISEARKPNPHPRVQQRLDALDLSEMFISVISLGEIKNGAMRLAPGARRQELETWLSVTQSQYADRILPVDLQTALLWGEMAANARRIGRVLHPADGLIAATAIRRGLHLWTRNTADFQPTGVLLFNPWDQ
ncbi:MAG: type II toxin-antitoxin system VapC family toxin [Planctomycetaceae bacterium]|jgi:predicted nucleic acid-binding protein|nr:type II toxin-antitoxin system VapC family toxin [Phycisphaerales bacterium]MCE2654688.1 type II toxin-antitoxin system VapC family toxin [Planctomycetaceae bacterium]